MGSAWLFSSSQHFASTHPQLFAGREWGVGVRPGGKGWGLGRSSLGTTRSPPRRGRCWGLGWCEVRWGWVSFPVSLAKKLHQGTSGSWFLGADRGQGTRSTVRGRKSQDPSWPRWANSKKQGIRKQAQVAGSPRVTDLKEFFFSRSVGPLTKARSCRAHWRRELRGRRVLGTVGEVRWGPEQCWDVEPAGCGFWWAGFLCWLCGLGPVLDFSEPQFPQLSMRRDTIPVWVGAGRGGLVVWVLWWGQGLHFHMCPSTQQVFSKVC